MMLRLWRECGQHLTLSHEERRESTDMKMATRYFAEKAKDQTIHQPLLPVWKSTIIIEKSL